MIGVSTVGGMIGVTICSYVVTLSSMLWFCSMMFVLRFRMRRRFLFPSPAGVSWQRLIAGVINLGLFPKPGVVAGAAAVGSVVVVVLFSVVGVHRYSSCVCQSCGTTCRLAVPVLVWRLAFVVGVVWCFDLLLVGVL